ncbi:hypothetical protein AGMMS49938_16240 [Fibrobacterales bacterium]|nr:hypothetical protein AGMMS49938_16240 [Fibrobacterales bacterium]
MSDKWKLFWVGAFAFVVLFQACGMHSWQELLISTDDEKKLGKEYDSLIRVGDKSVMEAGESIFTPKTAADTVLYKFRQHNQTNQFRFIEKFGEHCSNSQTRRRFFEECKHGDFGTEKRGTRCGKGDCTNRFACLTHR